ncbi:MAG: hypothetical protein VB131_08235, partial [Burkholderia gladioli]
MSLASRFSRRRWLAACAGALLLAGGLAGCDQQPAFQNLDITGNTQFGKGGFKVEVQQKRVEPEGHRPTQRSHDDAD